MLDFSKLPIKTKDAAINRFIGMLKQINEIASLDNIVFENYASQLSDSYYEIKVKNLEYTILRRIKDNKVIYLVEGSLDNTKIPIPFVWHESYEGLNKLFYFIEKLYYTIPRRHNISFPTKQYHEKLVGALYPCNEMEWGGKPAY